MTLVCVVMRSEGNDRFTDTIKLFDYGFDNSEKLPVYWLKAPDSEEPDGYVILPKGASTASMMVTDQDTEGVSRTRTYSYQGREILKLTAAFPLQVETRTTSDMSMFKVGTVKKQLVSPLVFPAMLLIFAGLCAGLVSVLVQYVRKKKAKKNRKQRKKITS